MEIPPRGEIWRGWVEGVGREIGGKMDPERACFVGFFCFFNEEGDRLSIVPFTDYTEGKEDTMSLWGLSIRLNRDINNYNPRSGDEGREKSIIDCGQIYTVPLNWLDDDQWRHCYGSLKDLSKIRVEIILQ